MKTAPKRKSIYLIGSLANPKIPYFGNELRELGFEVYDQWWAPGPLADSYWRHYTKIRKMSYKDALNDLAAKHIFEFDKGLIDQSNIVVLLMNGGRSAHLELGYAIGMGKKGYILFDKEPKRYDVMYQFATDIFFNKDDLFDKLKEL